MCFCGVVLIFLSSSSGGIRFTEIAKVDTKSYALSLPRPIIADLNGDDIPDLVFAGMSTPDKITVATLHHDKLIYNHMVSVITLPGILSSTRIIQIAVARVGGLRPWILAVTSNLDLIVFDEELRLQWVANIPYDGERTKSVLDHYDIALLGVDVPVWNGDSGLIVVGVRPNEKESDNWERHEMDFNIHSNTKVKENHLDSSHYNYYAYESRTGVLRWNKSNQLSIWNDLNTEHNSTFSDHSWKLHVINNNQFYLQDWQQFHDSVLESLPHQWYSPADTTLKPALFKKKSSFATSKNEKETQRKTTKNTPNTIVAHTSHGMEMIHLYTGRTITNLKLRNGAVFVDLDFDDTIDQIWTSVGHEAQHHKVGEIGDHSCSAIFGSGVPDARQVIDNIPICFTGGWFVNQPVQEESKKYIRAAPPALIKRSNTSPFRSSVDYISVFLLSSGTLTAVRDYFILWQIMIEDMKFFESGFPSIVPFSLDSTREQNDFHEDILVVTNKIALISSHGRILAEKELESIPKTYPVIGDINGDGLNDVIIVSDSRFTLYVMEGTLQSSIFPFIIGLLLLLVIAIHIHRYINPPHSNPQGTHKKYSID